MKKSSIQTNQVKNFLLQVVLCGGVACSTGMIRPAQAGPASTPDAGSLLETLPAAPIMEEEAGKAVINVPATVSPTQETASADAKGPVITARRFIVNGATVFSADLLASLLDDLLDKPLPLSTILEGAERITKYYHNAGYFVARAFLPPQSGLRGEFRIDVVEGRIGEVKLSEIANDPGGRVGVHLAATLEAQGVTKDQLLERNRLERGLLLLGDIVGSEVQVGLRPGASVGASDLDLETEGKNRISGNVSLDNYGTRHTGIWRLNAGANLAHPLLAGDVLGLRGVVSQGMKYLLASYQFPLGHDGLKLGLNAGSLNYTLCCGAPTDSSGEAQTFTATASYPLILTQARALHLEGSLERKALKDEIKGANIDDKRINSLSLGVSGRQTAENLLQRGQVAFTRGKVDLSGNAESLAQDRNNARTNGSYDKFKLNYSARFQATTRHVLELRINGQYAPNNLDSSEKLSLGGIDGIRAYPTSEGSGDTGIIGRLEWAMPIQQETLPGQLGVNAFLDGGYIRLDAKPWPGGLAGRNQYGLSGIGIGGSWAGPKGMTLGTALATPLGNNPGRINGKDSDDKNDKARFWLMFNLPL
ncbi:putative ShlB/FhaC/HecB family hemolysin secretion/activation protein [Gammaproteobacteria bacterium]